VNRELNFCWSRHLLGTQLCRKKKLLRRGPLSTAIPRISAGGLKTGNHGPGLDDPVPVATAPKLSKILLRPA
jgi:hypothetical protein